MPSAPATSYSFLAAAIADDTAAGFVSVADRSDPGHRYLTRYRGPPGTRYAFVFVDGRSYLCAPPGDGERAAQEFTGATMLRASEQDASTPGERAADVLAAHDATGTVLVPRHVPHDAAIYLQQAGFRVASTTAVEQARAEKTSDERACLTAVQDAATEGMTAVETMLACATVDGERLHDGESALTAASLRDHANAALAEAGVTDAGNTVVATGHGAGRPNRDDVPIRSGQPVVVALRPRGPWGYHGYLVRTFVPASDGGWDRRAHLAATAARDAGLDAMASGGATSSIDAEIAAEAAAYGFERGGEAGFTGPVGHGVGLAAREAPLLDAGGRLAAGNALAVGARIEDPDEGCVWVGDLAFVTADGVTVPAPHADKLVPRERP